MSGPSGWLGTRRPEPPADLRARVLDHVTEVESESVGPPGTAGGSVMERLLKAGRDRLDRARVRPGRVRESAFELLVADALVTYACEAALESEDPVTALEAVVEVGRRQ